MKGRRSVICRRPDGLGGRTDGRRSLHVALEKLPGIGSDERLVEMDVGNDRGAEEQRLLVRVVSFKLDADRQPLDDLDEVAGGILRRQQCECRSRPHGEAGDPAVEHLAVATVPPRPPGPWEPLTSSQTAVPATSAPPRGDSHAAARRARTASGPAVLSARNVAPCARNTVRLASPPTIATGARRPPKLPRYRPAEESGSPCTRLVKARPQPKAGTRLVTASATSQPARHRALSRLPRNSKLTPRTISATSTMNSAR